MPIRLLAVADLASTLLTPLGFQPWIWRKGGWEAMFAERPYGAEDNPSVDETIAAGWGYCLSRGTGFQRGGESHIIGYYHHTGQHSVSLRCDMRGPGAFSRFDEHPDGLHGWIDACAKRNAMCAEKGLDSCLYMGLPRADVLDGLNHSRQMEVMSAWTWPIKAAGFSRVQLDSAAATAQWIGHYTAGYRWAEHMLYEGIAVDVETLEIVTPTAFPWFNGRFGCVASDNDRTMRSGAGWFNSTCPGVVTRRFLWLQGSIPPAERKAKMDAELARPDGDTPIVEPAQWWYASREGNGTPASSSSPQAQTDDLSRST